MSLGSMEQREGMEKRAQELIEQAYQCGFKAGQERAKEMEISKYIEKGRNEAWGAIKRIVLPKSKGGLSLDELKKLFGTHWFDEISEIYTLEEILDKIHDFEKKQKQKQEESSKIRVGDEVIYNCGNDKGKATVIDVDVDVLHLLTENGCYISEEFKDVKKTNRNFSEIAEVVKKMKEEQ